MDKFLKLPSNYKYLLMIGGIVVVGGTVNEAAQVEISVEDMLEKMAKVLSEEEVDFWSDCADQISVLSEVIKSSPQLSDKQKVEKLEAMLNEYGYFAE